MAETERLYNGDYYSDIECESLRSQISQVEGDEVDLQFLTRLLGDREKRTRYQHRSQQLRDLLATLLLWAWRIFKATLKVLLPSFLQHGDAQSEEPGGRGGANGALDGLRGVACLIVAIYHFFNEFFDLTRGYVYDPQAEDGKGGPLATWLNLPVIGAFHNGPNMVAVFFAISGYVLSHRFILLSAQGNADRALSSMPSAIFRRWMRLFAPVGVSFALVSIFLWMGVYKYSRKERDDFTKSFSHEPGPFPIRGRSALEQFLIWWSTWRHLFFAFSWQRFGPTALDSHAWTIGVEYRCSIVIFMLVTALAKVKKLWIRLSTITLTMAWALEWDQRAWEVVLFLGGMMWAELNVASQMKSSVVPIEKPSKHAGSSSWLTHLLWTTALLTALHFCSIPSLHLWDENVGWGFDRLRNIDPLPPSYIFNTWSFLGAFLLIGCVTRWRPLQNLLNTRFAQYTGRISYALYLTHGPLLKCLAWLFVSKVFSWAKWEMSFHAAFRLSCGLSFAAFLPCAVFVADLFMRCVDVPSVTLSRKLWEFCTS